MASGNREQELAIKIAGKVESSFKKSLGLTEEGLNNLASTAKKTASIAAKAFASITAVAGAAVVALGKQSLEAYAQNEQLVGGVETLFGAGGQSLEEYAASVGKSVSEVQTEYDNLMKAQGTVFANANNAYKTAGLSANEYMETVTGFSAALIQSVGGDTEKAALLADQAIIDMADNANKMGSSIEDIQRAYGGFAKQNFGMLDNLKLGYGGTKEEMERLLADAEKLSGVKYDISSYADITEAIHVIQTEMGIAGTTAKEASSTISGSISAMGSAWQNLMAGMADSDVDLGPLIANLTDSLNTVIDNVLPRAQDFVTGLIQVIEGLLPQVPPIIDRLLPEIIKGATNLVAGIVKIAPQLIATVLDIIPQLIDALIGMIPTIVDAVMQVIPMLIDAILTSLPKIITLGIELIKSLLAGLQQAIPQVVTTVIELVPDIIDALVSQIPTLLQGAIDFLMAIVQALPSVINALVAALPELINTVVDTLVNSIPVIIDGAIQLFMGILQALPEIVLAIANALPTVVGAIVNGLINGIDALINGAIQLLMGIIQAIPQFLPQLISTIPTLVTSIVSTLIQNIPVLIQGAIQLFMALVQAIPTIIVELANAIPTIITAIMQALASLPGQLIGLFSGAWTSVKGVFSSVGTFFGGIFQGAWNAITGVFSNIAGFFQGVWDKVVAIFTSIGTAISDAISGAVKGAINTVLSGAAGIINGFIGAINTAIGIINAIPGVEIGKLSKLEIPALANGGIIDQPTLAMVGEGKDSEAVVPLGQLWDKMRSIITGIMAGNQSGAMGNALSALTEKIGAMAQGTSQTPFGELARNLIGGIGGNGNEPQPAPAGGVPIHYAPVYNFNGGTPTKDDLVEAERMSQAEFNEMMEQWQKDNDRKRF